LGQPFFKAGRLGLGSGWERRLEVLT